MRQIAFQFHQNYKKEFGGNYNTQTSSAFHGKRKTQRPLSIKAPLHLVLKSGKSQIFNPGNAILLKLIRSTANRFQIKIYELALNWTHIHFLIKFKSRKDYIRFIRALTSLIAQKFGAGVFSLLPYTRVVSWGRDFKNAIAYILLNQQEALGLVVRNKSKSKNRSSKSNKAKSSHVKPVNRK